MEDTGNGEGENEISELCVECILGYGLNDAKECETCLSLSDGCRKCNLGIEASCTDCKPGYGLMYESTTKGYKCIPCTESSNWGGGGNSLSCKLCRKLRRVIDINGQTSIEESLECLERSNCPEYCLSCNEQECTEWHEGYYKESALILRACMENCLKCVGGESCDMCKAGFTPSPSKTSCVSCKTTDPMCSQCSWTSDNQTLKCKGCWGPLQLTPHTKNGGIVCGKDSCEEMSNCALCTHTLCLMCSPTHYLEHTGGLGVCNHCVGRYPDCLHCSPTACTQCLPQAAGFEGNLGELLCRTCTRDLLHCGRCTYNILYGMLSCVECGTGYEIATGHTGEYSYCRQEGTTADGCIEGLQLPFEYYCTQCGYGYLDLHSSGKCKPCGDIIDKCLGCGFELNLPTCILCYPGYSVHMGICVEDNCETPNCLQCLPEGGCGTCLQGYSRDSTAACTPCHDLLHFQGCGECLIDNAGQATCLSCLDTYGEQKGDQGDPGVICKKCSEVSAGCHDCELEAMGGIVACRGCVGGYSLVEGGCLECSKYQGECLVCIREEGEGVLPHIPTKCLMCKKGYDLVESEDLVGYCRAKGCEIENCVWCEGEGDKCSKCFGESFLTPDRTSCFTCPGGCLKCSVIVGKGASGKAEWQMGQCFQCPPNQVYNGGMCVDALVEHCHPSSALLRGGKAYCAYCLHTYIPKVQLIDYTQIYPFYAGETCILESLCSFLYNTTLTTICITNCPLDTIPTYIQGQFLCYPKPNIQVIERIYVSNQYHLMSNLHKFDPTDSTKWVGDINKPVYNLFLAYLKVPRFIYYIYIYIGTDYVIHKWWLSGRSGNSSHGRNPLCYRLLLF